MQLSPHFTLEELTITQHRNIDNTPAYRERANLEQVAYKLETIRSKLMFPLIISSGYRCLELNRSIGSKDNSAHVKGLAVDFICPRFGLPSAVFDYLLTQKDLKYDQLILEKIGGKQWLHIGLRENPEDYRQQCLIIDETGVHSA